MYVCMYVCKLQSANVWQPVCPLSVLVEWQYTLSCQDHAGHFLIADKKFQPSIHIIGLLSRWALLRPGRAKWWRHSHTVFANVTLLCFTGECCANSASWTNKTKPSWFILLAWHNDCAAEPQAKRMPGSCQCRRHVARNTTFLCLTMTIVFLYSSPVPARS